MSVLKNTASFLAGALVALSVVYLICVNQGEPKQAVSPKAGRSVDENSVSGREMDDTPDFMRPDAGWTARIDSAALSYLDKERFIALMEAAFLDQDVSAMRKLFLFYSVYCIPDDHYYTLLVMLAMHGNEKDLNLVCNHLHFDRGELEEGSKLEVISRLKQLSEFDEKRLDPFTE
ncbi:hypothetical protein Rhal01_03460 [Rubritalea halochordaticola]|uniref:DUF4476 domain-containing protein n=1 Tax=Rubritalea halochordaticola TaxID=714537 RepID=A0ABP9V7B9_9BACT